MVPVVDLLVQLVSHIGPDPDKVMKEGDGLQIFIPEPGMHKIHPV